ncbi:MAG: hypothetical protein V4599_06855 [Verrucomicrobiota bacterium]
MWKNKPASNAYVNQSLKDAPAGEIHPAGDGSAFWERNDLSDEEKTHDLLP